MKFNRTVNSALTSVAAMLAFSQADAKPVVSNEKAVLGRILFQQILTKDLLNTTSGGEDIKSLIGEALSEGWKNHIIDSVDCPNNLTQCQIRFSRKTAPLQSEEIQVELSSNGIVTGASF